MTGIQPFRITYSLIKTVDLDKISSFSYQKGQSFPNLADLIY